MPARRLAALASTFAGNASAAAVTGGLAYFFGPAAAFWVLAAMAVGAVLAMMGALSVLSKGRVKAEP